MTEVRHANDGRSESLRDLGESVLAFAAVVGGMTRLLGKLVSRLVRADLDGNELRVCLDKMAVRSAPIVVVTAIFTGAIMVLQSAPVVQRWGAEGLLGWGAGFGILREVAPLLTALMISGRVGANNAAELGTMAVTEQFDALRVLAIDPISLVVLPRFIGIVVTLVVTTIYADVLALIGAALTGNALLRVSVTSFYNGLTSGLLHFDDVATGVVKSFAFGFVIALTSCYFGLMTKGGAPGVGRTVNRAVVASATGVFLLDYLVSFGSR